MKRIVLAVAAAAAFLTASAPAEAGGLDGIVGDIAQAAIGQVIEGAIGGGRGYQRTYRQPRHAEPRYVEDGYGDTGYGSVYRPYDRYSERLADIYGQRRVERCGADPECAHIAVGLIRRDDADRLNLLFRRIRG